MYRRVYVAALTEYALFRTHDKSIAYAIMSYVTILL